MGKMPISSEEKPICVVIDTNIWIKDSNLLLKTAMGSALLYMLKQSNGKIGLPEIIEEELIRNTVEQGLKAAETIDKNFKNLQVIMGSISPYEVPNREKLEATVKERLAELEDLIVRIPFTFEHAKGALRRINEKSPPNGEKNQQFKDSAIWEALLNLLESYTVYFISEDNGFYQNRKDNRQLASNLLEDCQKKGGTLKMYRQIDLLLKELNQKIPPIEEISLIEQLNAAIHSKFRKELLSEVGFEVCEIFTKDSSCSAFFTESQDYLALSFNLLYSCQDIKNTGQDKRLSAKFKVEGNCLYEFKTQTISAIELERERFDWFEPTGEPNGRGIVYANFMVTVGGKQKINYSLREPFSYFLNE